MERRILLAGLAAGAALATGPALAQVAAPGLSDAARAHVRDTMAAGARSLAVTRVAKAKLKHPMTLQFADFEASEQDGLAGVLKARLTPGTKPDGAIVPPTDAEVEAALDADGRSAVAKFRDMGAGPEFEKSYVQAEVEGHVTLLAIQDAYLKVADDEAETAIAKLVKGRVQEHLVILGDIVRHLG